MSNRDSRILVDEPETVLLLDAIHETELGQRCQQSDFWLAFTKGRNTSFAK